MFTRLIFLFRWLVSFIVMSSGLLIFVAGIFLLYDFYKMTPPVLATYLHLESLVNTIPGMLVGVFITQCGQVIFLKAHKIG